jgi:hypothetical protein
MKLVSVLRTQAISMPSSPGRCYMCISIVWMPRSRVRYTLIECVQSGQWVLRQVVLALGWSPCGACASRYSFSLLFFLTSCRIRRQSTWQSRTRRRCDTFRASMHLGILLHCAWLRQLADQCICRHAQPVSERPHRALQAKNPGGSAGGGQTRDKKKATGWCL